MDATAIPVKVLSLPVQLALVGACAALLLGWRARRSHALALGGLGVAVFVLREVVLFAQGGMPGNDFRVYWTAGEIAREGGDPYAVPDRFNLPMVYLPNVLPLSVLLAALPFPAGFAAWTVVTGLLSLALVPLAVWALGPPAEGGRPPAAGPEFPVLCGLFPVSLPVTLGLEVGQVAILVAACVFLALAARRAGRPGVAGLLLAVAGVKPGLAAPFLILFLRRDCWRAWPWFAAGTAALLVAGSPAGEVPRRIAAGLELARVHNAEGGVNSYGYTENSESRLGVDLALYRLGVRGHDRIVAVQTAAVLGLGGLLAAEVAWVRRLPAAAVCSLVCLYAMVFFYHRVYDGAVLALPLAYALTRARRAAGRARWLYAGSGLAQLVVLCPWGRVLKWVQEESWGWGGWGDLARAVVLPVLTWAVLAALVTLWLAARAEGRQEGPGDGRPAPRAG